MIQLFLVSFLSAAETVIEGAKKEGAVVFYTTMDIQNSKPLLDNFTKKYPFIKGDLVGLGGTAMVSRIMAEAQAGANKFDVAVGISPSYIPMRERNLIAPYMSPEFPTLYDDLYEPKGYWATVYLNTLVVGYNTKVIPATTCLRPMKICSNLSTSKSSSSTSRTTMFSLAWVRSGGRKRPSPISKDWPSRNRFFCAATPTEPTW